MAALFALWLRWYTNNGNEMPMHTKHEQLSADCVQHKQVLGGCVLLCILFLERPPFPFLMFTHKLGMEVRDLLFFVSPPQLDSVLSDAMYPRCTMYG